MERERFELLLDDDETLAGIIKKDEIYDLIAMAGRARGEWLRGKISGYDVNDLCTALVAVSIAYEDGMIEGQTNDRQEDLQKAALLRAKAKEMSQALAVVRRYALTWMGSEVSDDVRKYNLEHGEQCSTSGGRVWEHILSLDL